MQNVDKVAYGIVGVLVVGLCALAFFIGGEGGAAAKVQAALDKCDEKANGQDVTKERAPDLAGALEGQTPSASADAMADWTMYRRPARVEQTAKVVRIPATHEGPELSGVEVTRSKAQRRSVVKITGTAGESKDIKGLEIYLDGMVEEGEWEELDKQVGVPGEDFDFEYDKAELGKRYKFRVRSKAASATTVPLPPDQTEHESDESDFVLVPLDRFLRCSSATPGSFGDSGFTPGRANFALKKWNYDKMGWDQESANRTEANIDKSQKWQDNKPIFDTELRVERIEEDSKTRKVKVTLRDPANFRKSKRVLIAGERFPNMETGSWVNPAAGGDSMDEAGDDIADDDTADDAPADEPEEDDDDGGGGGLFGGGDDDE